MFGTWKNMAYPGIQMTNTSSAHSFLLTNNSSKSGHDLHPAVCKLTHIDKNYSFKIHANKVKTVAFRGKFPIRTNVVNDKEPFEEASPFHIRCCTTCDTNKDAAVKLNKYTYCTLKRTLKIKPRN